MLTVRTTVRIVAIVSASAVWASSGLVWAAPPRQPNQPSLRRVSDALTELAQQHADKARTYEAQGHYLAALQEYREAIAWIDQHFGATSDRATGNPKALLVRAGAEVDSARALSRSPGGPGMAEIGDLARKAEADFTTVIRIVTP